MEASKREIKNKAKKKIFEKGKKEKKQKISLSMLVSLVSFFPFLTRKKNH